MYFVVQLVEPTAFKACVIFHLRSMTINNNDKKYFELPQKSKVRNRVFIFELFKFIKFLTIQFNSTCFNPIQFKMFLKFIGFNYY